MNDGPDFHQQDERLHEAWELLQEADAKRRERELEMLHEMNKGLDDSFEPADDEAFMRSLEDKYPSLLGAWPMPTRKEKK